MKIDIQAAQVAEALFVAGTNFGLKLSDDPKSQKGVKMYYDTDLKMAVMLYQGTATIINWVSLTLKDPSQLGIVFEKPAAVKKPDPFIEHAATQVKAQVSGPEKTIRTAQVSDPTKAPPKTILRKAKYQGEESQGE